MPLTSATTSQSFCLNTRLFCLLSIPPLGLFACAPVRCSWWPGCCTRLARAARMRSPAAGSCECACRGHVGCAQECECAAPMPAAKYPPSSPPAQRLQAQCTNSGRVAAGALTQEGMCQADTRTCTSWPASVAYVCGSHSMSGCSASDASSTTSAGVSSSSSRLGACTEQHEAQQAFEAGQRNARSYAAHSHCAQNVLLFYGCTSWRSTQALCCDSFRCQRT